MDAPRHSAVVTVMIGAARKAARGLLRDFNEVEHLQVSKKGPADFVSAADRKAEKVIGEELKRARPEFGLLMEETGVTGGGLADEHRFIVDPLDGTTNFLHGLPHWAISIAYEQKGRIAAGVIFDPVKNELFWAEKGKGAYLNDRRLRVSARRDLTQALLATGIPYAGKPGHDALMRDLVKITNRVAGIRRFGSAALDLAYVAAGRYDGFWERGLSPWDMAAGILMVREAGGTVTDVLGGPDILETGSVLAANADLHDPVRKLLRSAARGGEAARKAAAEAPAEAPEAGISGDGDGSA
ncbi:inositol monophosphatase family protein [Futiania mangrovi]|uniref:Inositol-1-monophosphatase n=1 Tax=Futiania mangrovi TaxID=2959716 RepID=A0A9J6PFI9_9PROT|nr:inositol monophosphatase family protein [Futiania mangrovii]MCP1334874.1 inositol monophosphatase [Futiania mangrovii]